MSNRTEIRRIFESLKPRLYPCPFCGNADFLVYIGPYDKTVRVECSRCGAHGAPSLHFKHDCLEEYVEAACTFWNTRMEPR